MVEVMTSTQYMASQGLDIFNQVLKLVTAKVKLLDRHSQSRKAFALHPPDQRYISLHKINGCESGLGCGTEDTPQHIR